MLPQARAGLDERWKVAYQRDRDITRELPGYRRMLAFLTPDRDAATVTFTQTLDLTETLPWLEARSAEWGQKVSLLTLYVAAVGRLLHDRPSLNRYVTGTRFFQRDGVFVSISAKKALKHGAKVVMLKVPLAAGDGVRQVADRLRAEVSAGRGSEDLRVEKEVDLFLKLPAFVLKAAIRVIFWLDRRHWLPGFFVDPDPMFTSMAIANLGSVGLDAAHHHLYEYGNCPFFVVLGRIQDTPLLVDGALAVRKTVDVKYTFDERIEDGLACAIALKGLKDLVEHPDRFEAPPPDLGDAPPDHV